MRYEIAFTYTDGADDTFVRRPSYFVRTGQSMDEALSEAQALAHSVTNADNGSYSVTAEITFFHHHGHVLCCHAVKPTDSE